MSPVSLLMTPWRAVWFRGQPPPAPVHPAATAVAPAPVTVAPETRARVLEEIDGGKTRVSREIGDLKRLSERAALACGHLLSGIVDTVRHLIGEADRAATESRARFSELTSRFVGEMQDDIRAQQTAVDEVLRLADGIEGAVDAINSLTLSSHMLAINASIEAARLGPHGRGVAVIAGQMREMSHTVRVTAETVRASIDAVRAGLPPVRERAACMHERTRTFIEVVAEQMKLASLQADADVRGNGRLDTVIEMSNKALSHLQFQDPFAQRLSSIDGDLDVLEARVRRVLDGIALEPLAAGDPPRGDAPPAGEVRLF
jgi:hypothetical protein